MSNEVKINQFREQRKEIKLKGSIYIRTKKKRNALTWIMGDYGVGDDYVQMSDEVFVLTFSGICFICCAF